MALKLGKKRSPENGEIKEEQKAGQSGSKPVKLEKRSKKAKKETAASQKKSSRGSKKRSSKKAGKYLSIDLGSYSIKGVVGIADPGRIGVDAAFEAILPEGFYENGRIRDKEEFKSILTRVLAENGIKVRDVIVTIDTSELIKREIVFPDVEGVDLEEAISYELADHLPIDVNNYILQPRVMARYTEEGQKKQRILVAALPKDLVETLFFGLQEAGLKPVALDIHSNAIEKIFNENHMPSFYHEDKTFVFVDLGYKATNVVIVEGQDYRFNRILRFGSSLLDSGDRERVSRESVVELLDEMSRSAGQSRHMDTLLSQIAAWGDDIEKVLNYYRSRSTDSQIERILVYGGCSRFRDIDLFFEKRLNIPVTVVERLERVEFPPSRQGDLFKYVNALSALIRR